MKRYKIKGKTDLRGNETVEGETIEQKIERIMESKEPIEDGAPIIFTERKEGVIAAYNIRTDRFEIACEAMDSVSGSIDASRDNKGMEKEETKVISLDNDTKESGT